jgi:hypothetical protein
VNKYLSNKKIAKAIWGELSSGALRNLKDLTETHGISIAAGDLQFLEGRWYVTHAGLLRIALRNRCYGIRTIVDKELSDPASNRWVVRATVYKSPRSGGFTGLGDSSPGNTSPLIHGAELRAAETRAIDRALRAAYGVGLCSVSELGWTPRSNCSGESDHRNAPTNGNNGHFNGQSRLRDRLCILIRQHHLDAGQVKAYAAEFCGTSTLREAGRDQVERFVSHLAVRAAKDRDGLICELNSYSKSQEGVS